MNPDYYLDENKNLISSNPGFVNPGSGDFSLNSGSPAIGKASPLCTVREDSRGRSRPSSGCDIGATEQ
jgi:hypothetical protein